MRILLVDDHALFRHGLHLILAELGQAIEIIEVERLESALMAAPAGIDMVLIEPCGSETEASGLRGIDAVRAIRARFPKAQTVVVSTAEEPAFVLAVFDEGASGFIPKSSTPGVLLSALRLIRVGGLYVPRIVLELRRPSAQVGATSSGLGATATPPLSAAGVDPHRTGRIAGPDAVSREASQSGDPPAATGGSSEALLSDAQRLPVLLTASPSDNRSAAGHHPIPGIEPLAGLFGEAPSGPPSTISPPGSAQAATELTARQRQVLTLLVQGLSNKAIARQLDVSESTVKQHLSSSFRLLGVSNRTQAVYRSAELGLTPVGRHA